MKAFLRARDSCADRRFASRLARFFASSSSTLLLPEFDDVRSVVGGVGGGPPGAPPRGDGGAFGAPLSAPPWFVVFPAYMLASSSRDL